MTMIQPNEWKKSEDQTERDSNSETFRYVRDGYYENTRYHMRKSRTNQSQNNETLQHLNFRLKL